MKRFWLILLACFCFGAGVRENPKPIRIPDVIKNTGTADEREAWRRLEADLNAANRIIWEGVRSRPEVYYGTHLAELGNASSQCDTVIITNFDGQVVHYKCDTCFIPVITHVGVETSSLPAIQKPDTLVLGATEVVTYRLPTMISDSSFLVCIGSIGGTTYRITWVTVGR